CAASGRPDARFLRSSALDPSGVDPRLLPGYSSWPERRSSRTPRPSFRPEDDASRSWSGLVTVVADEPGDELRTAVEDLARPDAGTHDAAHRCRHANAGRRGFSIHPNFRIARLSSSGRIAWQWLGWRSDKMWTVRVTGGVTDVGRPSPTSSPSSLV